MKQSPQAEKSEPLGAWPAWILGSTSPFGLNSIPAGRPTVQNLPD